jgi:hypothetical protein
VAIGDDVPFDVRLAQTIAWCEPRVDVADPRSSLRTERIQPGDQSVLGDNRGSRVRFLCYQRASLLAASTRQDRRGFDAVSVQGIVPSSVSSAKDLRQGRLLVYFPDEQLADGAAEAESNGFFDVDNVPPWDTWVGLYPSERGEYLVSWVPSQLAELVGRGIRVNPEECIRWLDESAVPLVMELRTRNLLS